MLTSSSGQLASNVVLESNATVINGASEGISGFNTSIAVDSAGKPYITYTNNSKLGTKEALRFARASTASPTSASNWEYMIIPSPDSVRDDNTIIKMDGTTPVVVYKAGNNLYVARLK